MEQMTQYICEKHGIHYGACASCLRDRKKKQTQIIINDLKEKNKKLEAEACTNDCPFKIFRDA